MKYNYVLIWFKTDYYKVAYHDLEELPFVQMHWSMDSDLSPIQKKLYRLHTSPSLNRNVSIPFKEKWYPYLFKTKFDNNKPYCFIFTPKVFYEKSQVSYIDYLRKQYPGCKCVLYYQDIIPTHTQFQQGESLLSKFDKVITYDKQEAAERNILYYPTSFSQPKLNKDNVIEQDVLFVGRAKDRLPLLLKLYDILTEKGLTCCFKIAGVEPTNRIVRSNIEYIDRISYKENLELCTKSRCILDLLQAGATGCSLRFWESIALEKNLLTNNPNSPIDDANNVILFDENHLDDINTQKLVRETRINRATIESLSPVRFVEFVDSIL